jgi:hypothetical protein
MVKTDETALKTSTEKPVLKSDTTATTESHGLKRKSKDTGLKETDLETKKVKEIPEKEPHLRGGRRIGNQPHESLQEIINDDSYKFLSRHKNRHRYDTLVFEDINTGHHSVYPNVKPGLYDQLLRDKEKGTTEEKGEEKGKENKEEKGEGVARETGEEKQVTSEEKKEDEKKTETERETQRRELVIPKLEDLVDNDKYKLVESYVNKLGHLTLLFEDLDTGFFLSYPNVPTDLGARFISTKE